MKNSEWVIEARQLTVCYGNGTKALTQVDLTLPSGVICALLGSNGSGKSTLCKALMGLIRLTQGEVKILNQSLRQAQKQSAVAYVPQSEEVDWDFPVSVYDVVMMGRQGKMNWLRIPSAQDRKLVLESLKRVGMTEFADRQIGELSGGQRKRVFLARALAQQASILLLDEPFTGVDVITEQIIRQLMEELRDQGATILVVTHNLLSVPDYADLVMMLKQKVVAFGRTQEVFTQDNLTETFGGMIKELQTLGLSVVNSNENSSMTYCS